MTTIETTDIAAEELMKFLHSMIEIRKKVREGNIQTDPNFRVIKTMEEFILKHGQPFIPAPLPKNIKPMVPKYCFGNAARLARRKKLIYCEGYAVSIIPVHHAWCCNENNEVIDPTWGKGLAYFGVKFNLDYVWKTQTEENSSILDRWQENWELLQGKVNESDWKWREV